MNGATPNGHDLDRARSALRAIPADLPRDEWVRVGMAAHAAGLSFDDFDTWSAQADNYEARAARDTWRSIKPGRGIGVGTLFKLADEHGAGQRSLRLTSLSEAPPQAVVNSVQARAGMGAAEVWRRCKPAPTSHGYIKAKSGRADGLRVVPEDDPLRIAGISVAGWLVVPVVPLGGGEPVSLQFIPPPGEGRKLNLPGAKVAGVFTVGELEPAGTAYLCEGIGQAWACWKATGAAAVVCFGWGRVRAVAAELRQRDASLRLVLVPDRGKESDAERIALDVRADVAAMPDEWPVNADVNDLARRDGVDALEVLLSSAAGPAVPVHPLAQYLDLGAQPVAPRYVIPGFIGHGLVIIAGGHGTGKTTALLPLSMVAAGLHRRGDLLAPKHWRHVVYVTEDAEQAKRIVAGIVRFGGLGLDLATVRERLHLVEARRLEPELVAEVATTYRQHFARRVDGVEVLPLVVLDTKSAVLAMEEENSNSEASAIVARLKQNFEGLPVWLVGHLPKASMSRAAAAGLTLRGGGAFEADANQVLYLVKEGDARYLLRGKTRFEADWPELQIRSATAATMAPDEYGDMQAVTLRWGIAAPPEMTRREAQDQAQKAARSADAAALRDEVREVIDMAWRSGCPLNREGVKAKVRRNRNEVTDVIENLLSERWLHEVAIPSKQRTNPKRSAFLVNLTTEEHEAAVRGEGLPPAKLRVPESWHKPTALSVPEPPPQEQGGDTHARKA